MMKSFQTKLNSWCQNFQIRKNSYDHGDLENKVNLFGYKYQVFNWLLTYGNLCIPLVVKGKLTFDP